MGQLNRNKKTEILISEFGGGYAGAKAIGNLQKNEAQDLDNIIVLPRGTGFRNMPGTKQVSPTGGSSQNISDFTVGVHATRIDLGGGGGSTSEDLRVITLASRTSDNDDINIIVHNIDSGTLSSTGLIHYDNATITKDSIFSMFAFNDSIIITSRINGTIDGGADTTPIKVGLDGILVESLQTGVAPQGRVGIAWNNRVWIGSTDGETSKLFHCALNDETDWNGLDAGFVNPNPDDADELVAVTPISNNVLLYFKQHSIYQVVGRTAPFAVFELFRGVGCIGNDALVNVDNLIYFITPQGQMRVTDGSRILDDRDIPSLSNADDLFQQIPVDRRPFIRGTRHKGTNFDWIIWLVSVGSAQTTNNQAIIWDLKNQCWLQATQGFAANNITSSQEGRTFIGSYDGIRIFEVGIDGYYKDDTDSTILFDGNGRLIAPTDSATMAWKWRSDDYAISLENTVQVNRINTLSKFDGNGNLSLNYRYDGNADSSDLTKAVVPGSLNHTTEVFRPLGRGDTFGFEVKGSSEVSAQISKVTLVGSTKGTKDPGVV